MKKMMKENKGFTLVELLIVVAIIAVLAAIAIPIMNQRLESSREATDVANIRTAYGLAVTGALTGQYSTGTMYFNTKEGTLVGTAPRDGGLVGTGTNGGTAVNLPASAGSYNPDTNYKGQQISVTFTDVSGEVTASVGYGSGN